MPQQQPRLTVIVVSYNTRELTLKCLRTLVEQTRSSFELIVVDNASADGSADAISVEFPEARLIRSRENIGFAAANNLAAQHARGEWILLLNPDTEVLDQAVDRLVEFGEAHPHAGIYGAEPCSLMVH